MIISKAFGTTAGGEAVTEYTLINKSGNSVSILNYGCIIRCLNMCRIFPRGEIFAGAAKMFHYSAGIFAWFATDSEH